MYTFKKDLKNLKSLLTKYKSLAKHCGYQCWPFPILTSIFGLQLESVTLCGSESHDVFAQWALFPVGPSFAVGLLLFYCSR